MRNDSLAVFYTVCGSLPVIVLKLFDYNTARLGRRISILKLLDYITLKSTTSIPLAKVSA